MLDRRGSWLDRRGFCVILPATMAGCASIIKGGSQEVAISSDPQGATVTIVDESGSQVFQGKTPATANLNKKKGYFSGKDYTIRIAMQGFDDREIKLSRTVTGWYILGNIVFGFLIGWFIVDPLTGAMWIYEPDEIDESFKEEQSTRNDGLTLHVQLLSETSETIRQSMVPLAI